MPRGRIWQSNSVLVGAQIINNLQSIVSRNVDPLKSAVVSICVFQAGTTDNVIPQTAMLRGTVRSLAPEVRDQAEQRVKEIAEGTAKLFGAEARVKYHRGYPVLSNHERETDFAASIATGIAGQERVDANMAPVMGAEDFSYMLQKRPGAFIFVGNGKSGELHHPSYDFNDDVIPFGTSYWVRLVETAMPA